jgi:hypothetical protein
MSGQDAHLSPCGTYRYRLRRWWNEPPKRWVLWIMLNPSTADASLDDPTIRRCIGFSKAWGFDGLMVGNLHALRATDPESLRSIRDPFGPGNGLHLREMARDAEQVICGWGAHDFVSQTSVASVLRDLDRPTFCLGTTKAGHPRHPLYVANATERRAFPTTEKP